MLDIKVYKYEKSFGYVQLDGVLQGFPIHEAVDDSLDTASIIINSPEENLFKLWQAIKIVADGFTKNFVVSDIQTKYRHVLSNDKYEHIVSLIEPTKYLEKVVCPSMSFTNKNNTLLEQVQRAILNAEPIEQGMEPRFVLSEYLIATLGDTPGEDFFFEKPLLREVLDTMLSVKNARCEVYSITDFNNIIINCYEQSKLGKKIEIVDSELVNKQSVQNIEYLGTDIEAYGDNSFSESREPIWEPSPNGWTTFKTEEATLTTNNATLKTAFPIEEIKKFVVKCVYKLIIMKDQTIYTTDNIAVNLDITSNVLTDEAYAILLEQPYSADKYNYFTDDLYKQNCISFKRENNTFQIEKTKSLFFTTTHLEFAIKNCLYKQKAHEKWLESHPSYYEYDHLDDIILDGFSYSSTLFRIQYIPYIDAHAKISKLNYTDVPSTIISNQSDKTIDLGRYGRNLYGQINRLGNKEITVDKMLYSMSEAYDVLDYTEDGYVVVERDLAFYNNYIKAHYKLSKDFNNLSEKIGIDRKKRIYNIPLESFVRDNLIKNNILVSTEPITDNSVMVSEFIKTFDNEQTRYPITNALVQTDVSKLFELPVAGYSMANSVFFKVKFMDNYSAGISTYGQVVGGKKQHPNPYVDKVTGEYSAIQIRLFNDILAERPDDYNTVKLLPQTDELYYSNAIIPFDKIYMIQKDAYEHHQFTIQLEIISNDPNIVIGFALAKWCSLLTDKTPNLKLYVSTNEKYSFINNQKPLGVLETNPAIEVFNELGCILVAGDTFYNNPSSIVSWGIADEKDNLLIGVNSSTNILYFGYSNKCI